MHNAVYKETRTDPVFGLEMQTQLTQKVQKERQSDLLHNVFGSFHSLSFDFNQQRMAGIGLILPLSI